MTTTKQPHILNVEAENALGGQRRADEPAHGPDAATCALCATLKADLGASLGARLHALADELSEQDMPERAAILRLLAGDACAVVAAARASYDVLPAIGTVGHDSYRNLNDRDVALRLLGDALQKAGAI